MKKIVLGISLVVATLFASNQYEVGIAGGRTDVTHSPMDNYNFLNLRIGKYLPKNHILRFELERSAKIYDNNRLTRALLNVEHYFTIKDSKITPYAFLGAGYQWVSGDYDNNMVADLGVGTKYSLENNFGLFAELRALRDFGNNDNHYSALLGLSYKFGETSKPAPVVKPLPKDSDKDGIIDSKDKCPNTPAGVKVDKNGCAIDSDHDEVPNYLDKCPNTPKGFKVDKNGCAITYNFQINFDNNSAKIKPEYMPKIEKFAKFLKNHPNVKAEIQGYTDNKGNLNYNMVLSERRAKAVYETLIKLGVDKKQISFVGYGPKNPIATNNTAEGRAKNRRVVAKIYY